MGRFDWEFLSKDVLPNTNVIVGLALLAGLGFFWPEVLGNGFSTITAALREEFPWKLLALLAGLKLVATALDGIHLAPRLDADALDRVAPQLVTAVGLALRTFV